LGDIIFPINRWYGPRHPPNSTKFKWALLPVYNLTPGQNNKPSHVVFPLPHILYTCVHSRYANANISPAGRRYVQHEVCSRHIGMPAAIRSLLIRYSHLQTGSVNIESATKFSGRGELPLQWGQSWW
jgi:hypothetical protein